MNRSMPARKTARRRFLAALGSLLALFVAACGRRLAARVPAALPTVSSPTQLPATSLPPTAVPTNTPLPPQPTAAPTLLPSVTAPASTAASQELLLLNGRVITIDATDTISQAVAVRDGLIAAVGSNDSARAALGPNAVVVDLKGKTLTPGLIDPHNHMQVMGMMQGYFLAFLPPDIKTIQDLQRKLAEVVAQTPAGEWIKGYYLAFKDERMPTRQDLDPVSPNHPVWLMQQGGHYGSANSVALQLAGISASTPQPSGGVVEMDARGEPTGVFYNHRAMDLLRIKIPPQTQEMVRDNVVSSQALFAACGVTTFHDNNVRGVDTIRTYLATGPQGQATLRGAISYTLEWPQDLERALDEVMPLEGKDAMMHLAGWKFLLDGQAKMAYCHEPHAGVRWDLPTWEPQSFKKAVRALHDTGLQISVHCIGDAATDLALDAYEEAMNANPRPDPRHRIEHCILCTPQATRRMKDLGVVVSAQPQFIRLGGDYWPTIFGPERTKRTIVTREWLEGGVKLALGSDAPTTPWYTPQATLAGAVSRIGSLGKPCTPEQCLTIQEALRAHTLGSAYALHEEGIKGSIEVGKLADLTVWREDPYTAPLERLWQIPMLMTIVGGHIVYQA